ncbi:transcriptional regulator with XRE-family HTH domain [Psychrobacillus insolitus]|uniref:Transcriptional regulator with XRE-family HTH domain n=1 Tax=Psychrobacillus insolitus TaxID=1461 RepID=A0A2W7PHX7_9BACI|nr:helix-turn-helix transcriptional regulator [Psychrobacillus insolitus]PZX07946.1 transcriptional regulator with XRE-family HTH domain [Psychrobacillus insolitus]
MKEHVGSKIRKIRKENKDTLIELAEKLGYDYSNLSKIERGLYGVSLDLIKSIAGIYDVSPNYFFGDDLTTAEGNLIVEDDLTPSALKNKYEIIIDGTEATEDEIKEAVRLIRLLRNKSL